MLKVFVSSPYRDDPARNTRLAQELCLRALDSGVAPFAPHLLYTQFLDDADDYDRALGQAAGVEFVSSCDEVWVWTRKGITQGMKLELERAHQTMTPIVYDPECWLGAGEDA